MYRIQIRQSDRIRIGQSGAAKPWYYRIVSPNGRILVTSETYANRPNATRAARKFVDDVYDAVLEQGEDAFTVEGNGE